MRKSEILQFLLLVATVILVLAGSVTVVLGECQVDELAKLSAPDAAAGDEWGYSVAISGDTAVVGAHFDDDNGDASGSAYVFRFDGSDWVPDAKLLASDGAAGAEFGVSVAVSDDTAVVGAFLDDGNNNRTGSAYVFRYDGSTWAQKAKLVASDGGHSDYFGRYVAVSGNAVLIGAHFDDDNGENSGSAYVFRYDGSGWTQEAKLLPSDGASYGNFGRAVSISGKVAVVGGYHASAYVFRFDGYSWVEEAKLPHSGKPVHASFGGAVSVSGNVMLIGASGDDENGLLSGSAYLFRYDGYSWYQEARLLPRDGASQDYFGDAVAIDGDVTVVGAWGDDDLGAWSGSAYLFRYDGSSWIEEAKMLASDGAAHDWFGWSVGISGDTALMGSDGDDDSGALTGSAYLFGWDDDELGDDEDEDEDDDGDRLWPERLGPRDIGVGFWDLLKVETR